MPKAPFMKEIIDMLDLNKIKKFYPVKEFQRMRRPATDREKIFAKASDKDCYSRHIKKS